MLERRSRGALRERKPRSGHRRWVDVRRGRATKVTGDAMNRRCEDRRRREVVHGTRFNRGSPAKGNLWWGCVGGASMEPPIGWVIGLGTMYPLGLVLGLAWSDRGAH